MDFLKQLLTALVAVLTLDTKGLGQNRVQFKMEVVIFSPKIVVQKLFQMFSVFHIYYCISHCYCSEKPSTMLQMYVPIHTFIHLSLQYVLLWDLCVALCHQICDSLFPFSDAGTRDMVCVCWSDVFMLLATVVRRDSSAAYPSVSAALGRRWRTFAGTPILCVCVCVF